MYNQMIPFRQLALSQLMGRGPMINNPENSGEYEPPRPDLEQMRQGVNFRGGWYGGGPGGVGIPGISVGGGRNAGVYNPPERAQNIQIGGGFYGGSSIPQIYANQMGRRTGGINPPRRAGQQGGGQQGNMHLADLIRQTMGRMY